MPISSDVLFPKNVNVCGSEGVLGSPREIRLVGKREALAVCLEGGVLLEHSGPSFPEEDSFILEVIRVQRTNPEVGHGQSVAQKESATLAIRLDFLEECRQDFVEAFVSLLRLLGLVHLELHLGERHEHVIVSLHEPVSLECRRGLKRIVTVFAGNEARDCQGLDKMLAVVHLKNRHHAVVGVLALDLGPHAHRNLNVLEIDTGMSEHHADGLGSTVTRLLH